MHQNGKTGLSVLRSTALEEIIGEWLVFNKKKRTQENYRRAISLWDGYLQEEKGCPPMTLKNWVIASLDDAKYFFKHLQDQGLSLNTIRLYHVALAGLYTYLPYKQLTLAWPNIFKNPLLAFPRGSCVPKRPTRALPSRDVLKIMKEASKDPRDHAIAALLFGCGLRRGELLKLKAEHFKSTSYASPLRIGIELYDTKGKAHDIQPCPEWVATIVWNYTSIYGLMSADLLFPFTPQYLHKIFKRICKDAGVDSSLFSLHSCRCTAINNLLEQGYSHRDVQSFSRHSSVTTVEVYDRKRNPKILEPKYEPY